MTDHPKVHIERHLLDTLREMCLELPKAVEAEAFGAPTFHVHRKRFAMTHRNPEDRSVPGPILSATLLGKNGWIGCWLDDTAMPDWEEIEDLVVESYRLIAPKRLVKQLDG